MSSRTVHLYASIRTSFDEVEGIATISLNRPAQLNAINSTVISELDEALEEVRSHEGMRVVILTGAGPRAFAAGADISEMRSFSAQQAAAFSARGQQVFTKMEGFPLPIIAAVNGFALGGGCELAMACDIILASRSAVFGQPEVKLGVIPGFGGSQRLSRLVGRQKARQLCYTGRTLKADEALSIGLVADVVDGDVVEAAREMARAIARNGPVAVSLCKRAINDTADSDLNTGLSHEQMLFGLCFATDDQTEGMAAFLEKRKPEFKGR
ncbi:MAG: enoyl-CoA hydratase/isomerase family protein [Alphaproteobacteria bacterium]|nr:enoyl-CoA hydratase/isomerase family protein [Alphaproteobacteria bacterium]MCB9796783.1 enoyl-CoA hydratase/isomerase family protein [Alphaproteobacteria bacterium]